MSRSAPDADLRVTCRERRQIKQGLAIFAAFAILAILFGLPILIGVTVAVLLLLWAVTR